MEKDSVHVWIASHIDSELRLQLFLVCLRSIRDQTRPPDKVFVSLSGNTITFGQSVKPIIFPKIVEDMLQQALHPVPLVFLYSVNDISQFEHLQNIANVDTNPDTYIMLCDDDDININNRIERQLEHMKKHNLCACRCLLKYLDLDLSQGGWNHLKFELLHITKREDYATTMIRRSVWNKWLEASKTEPDIMYLATTALPKNMDLAFSAWVRNIDGYGNLPEVLYAYRGHHMSWRFYYDEIKKKERCKRYCNVL